MANLDPSFDIDPARKGSYRRAADDICRALNILKVGRLPPVASFLFYYLACEKLAKIMQGVCKRKKAAEILNPFSKTPKPKEITEYLKKLGCSVPENDIDWIFDSGRPRTARSLSVRPEMNRIGSMRYSASSVIPAQAGIQGWRGVAASTWTPQTHGASATPLLGWCCDGDPV